MGDAAANASTIVAITVDLNMSRNQLTHIQSVDVVRILAVLGVITIHTTAQINGISINSNSWNITIFINQLTRFAVPFFFVIAGYFWGKKIRIVSDPIKISLQMIKKLLAIFVAWSLFYALPYNFTLISELGISGPLKAAYWNLFSLFSHPVTLFLQGTSLHLWFLISLVFAILICHPLIKINKFNLLVVLSCALYMFGLLCKSYADTPLGLTTNFNTRNGPFFSTIFFASGYYISKYQPKSNWLYVGAVITTIGFFVQFSELYFLNRAYGTSLRQDYMLGTYFVGIGTAIFALSNFSVSKNSTFSNVGKYTLGIYLIHVLFVQLLSPLMKIFDSPFLDIAYVCIVFLLSMKTVAILSRSQILRPYFL